MTIPIPIPKNIKTEVSTWCSQHISPMTAYDVGAVGGPGWTLGSIGGSKWLLAVNDEQFKTLFILTFGDRL